MELKRGEKMHIINPKMCRKNGFYVEVDQEERMDIPCVRISRIYNSVSDENSYETSNESANATNEHIYIRLDKPEYVFPENENKLTENEKEKFIKIMNTEHEGYLLEIGNRIKDPTGYEEAVHVWEDTFFETDIERDEDGCPMMPDYSIL